MIRSFSYLGGTMNSVMVNSCYQVKLNGAIVNPVQVSGKIGVSRGMILVKLSRGCRSVARNVVRRNVAASPVRVKRRAVVKTGIVMLPKVAVNGRYFVNTKYIIARGVPSFYIAMKGPTHVVGHCGPRSRA